MPVARQIETVSLQLSSPFSLEAYRPPRFSYHGFDPPAPHAISTQSGRGGSHGQHGQRSGSSRPGRPAEPRGRSDRHAAACAVQARVRLRRGAHIADGIAARGRLCRLGAAGRGRAGRDRGRRARRAARARAGRLASGRSRRLLGGVSCCGACCVPAVPPAHRVVCLLQDEEEWPTLDEPEDMHGVLELDEREWVRGPRLQFKISSLIATISLLSHVRLGTCRGTPPQARVCCRLRRFQTTPSCRPSQRLSRGWRRWSRRARRRCHLCPSRRRRNMQQRWRRWGRSSSPRLSRRRCGKSRRSRSTTAAARNFSRHRASALTS